MIFAVLFGVLSPAGAAVPRMLKVFMASLVVWILLAMALAGSSWPSLVGRWPRYEGLLTIGVYLAVFVVGAKVLGGNRSVPRWRVLRLSLAAVALPLLIVSIMESFGLRPLGGGLDVRPGATLGNATDQGLIGIMIAGVLSAQISHERGWQLWLGRAGLVAAATVVVLSGSRAALAGLAMVAIWGAVLWTRGRSRSPLMTVLGPCFSVAGLALIVLIVPATRERLFATGTVDGRWLLWDRSLALVRDHLWFGVGPSNFVDALPPYLNDAWASRVGDSFPTDSPHNWILQSLTAGGIPLLLLVLGCAAAAAWCFYGRLREVPDPDLRRQLLVGGVAVVAYALALLTHFTSIGTIALAALLCGGLVGRDRDASAVGSAGPAGMPPKLSRTGPLVQRIGGIVFVCGCLAVAIPATLAEWSMGAGAQAARKGEVEQAEQAFQLSRSLRPWDSDTALLAAQAFAGPATTGDQSAAQHAVEWGRLALDATPRSHEAGLALAVGLIYNGEMGDAKELLDRLLSEAPSSPNLYIQRGVANYGLGHPAESINDLQKAAALDPALEEPWRILSAIYERLGDAEAAQAARERVNALGS
ncbi:O-antigen ligase family protein [Arthrobacter pascens]|uniref:O-antigen ligase family protein n=1 Tax=Arthrobacter pascens TaxID=1677 RepID=UPI0027D78087|nr:O-antigen ligase family protein [Arthrobacter pascens]